MDPRSALSEEIARFVRESPANRHGDGESACFDEPLVGFASALDPLFESYKAIIGGFHWTPRELFEREYGSGSLADGAVISWILPITRDTRKSNRRQDRLPSREWARTRDFGEAFNDELRRRVVAVLESWGNRAVAPMLSPGWNRVDETPVGIASTWSERHAAYAAGLGTFSLNDGLITARGIAHRTGSVVTDLVVAPDERPSGHYRENCLTFRGEECGVCIGRCPAGAISAAGHDKDACSRYTYGTALQTVGEAFGVKVSGCGLCQTAVPCESRIPSAGR